MTFISFLMTSDTESALAVLVLGPGFKTALGTEVLLTDEFSVAPTLVAFVAFCFPLPVFAVWASSHEFFNDGEQSDMTVSNEKFARQK